MAIESLTGPLPHEECAPRIAGLSALKGLVLYGAILTFAGLYGFFMVKIASAPAGRPPKLDASLISAAAALAGVLGSAFALEIGTKTADSSTNTNLSNAIVRASTGKQKLATLAWRTLSLEPESTSAATPAVSGAVPGRANGAAAQQSPPTAAAAHRAENRLTR